MTTIDQQVGEDLFDPRVNDDPYSYFGALREKDPVHWNEQFQVWIVTRYSDIQEINAHPEIYSSSVPQLDTRPPYPPIDASDLDSYNFVQAQQYGRIVTADRPRHRDMRGALARYFTPTAVEAWRPLVQDAITDLLARVTDGHMDVVADFAVPFPLLVISELMDIPQEDRTYVRETAENLLIGPRVSPTRMREIADAMRSMTEYMTPLVEKRIKNPGEDMISRLCEAETAGAYTRDEVLQNIAFLVVAGHETTINLICNGLLALVRHPDQWELLRSDPAGLSASTTEECLRYDPPVKSIERIALTDTELGGKKIKAMDRVRWIIAAGNRDPRRFEDPDRFDITRADNKHLAFGHGIHTCLGAALTRIEGEETFKAFGEKFNNLKLLTEPVEHAAALHLRSLKQLEISWS